MRLGAIGASVLLTSRLMMGKEEAPGKSALAGWRKKFVMPGSWCCIVLMLTLVYFSVADALANERAALVIGNQHYSFAPLDTPETDARAMTERLRQAGYQVTRHYNLRQTEFYEAVDAFFAQHKSAKSVAFFYAGHAVQLNGRNFLIPIDIRKEDPDILSRMFDLRYLLNKLTELQAETKLVVLDACRDNLFSSHPNAASGLSELIAPPGTFVAFSTAPGSTAEDGDGKNSPYTTALLESLFQPGVKIEDAFKDVRRKVMFLTENAQIPWESTSLVRDFFVVPSKASSGKSSPSRKEKTSLGNAAVRSISVAQDDNDATKKKRCSRILAKLSMGLEALTDDENTALTTCRH